MASEKKTAAKTRPAKAASRAKTAGPTKPAKAKAKATKAKPSTPAVQLVEHESGQVSLILCGPGYAWERIARKVAHAAKLRGISFDPEASMFCAHGRDRTALVKLAALLQPYLDDRENFREMETAARAEGND